MVNSGSGVSKVLVGIIALIAAVVASLGTRIYDDYIVEDISLITEVDNDFAIVQKINGVYVFLKSRPLSQNYSILGPPIQTNLIFRAFENSKGKKGVGEILKGIGNSLSQDFSFEKRLNVIIEKTIEKYPEVDGIILTKDLTLCEAIKFNK
jgi:hypothetical protein